MTLPRNFPERKNQRRERALELMKKQLVKKPDDEQLKDAIANTLSKIPEESQRGVRTKKNRGKKGGR